MSDPKQFELPTENTFRCDGCEEIFRTFWKFRAHFMKAHVVTHKLFCKYCKKKFTRPLYYKTHFLEHHPGESLFPCFCCRSSYQHKYDLNKHLKDHIQLEDLRNVVCRKKRQPKVVQKKQCTAECDVCGKEFGRKIDLYRHLLGVKVFLTCRVCQKSFCTRDAMEEHTECHYRSNESLFESLDSPSCLPGVEETSEDSQVSGPLELVGYAYKCDGCQELFPTPKQFRDHFLKVHIAVNKGHQSIYEKKFSHLIDLKSCFPEKKLFPCLLCNKTFAQDYFLKEHLKTHNSGQLESIACEFCGKRFESKVELYQHRRVIFTCSVCCKDFCNQKALAEHTIAHQENEKKTCPTCKEEFIDSNMLKTHRCGSAAETKTPINCSFCPRSFAQIAHLKLHIHRSHKNVTIIMV